MNKPIRILISGPIGSGKGIVQQVLMEALTKTGWLPEVDTSSKQSEISSEAIVIIDCETHDMIMKAHLEMS